jgi:hypothetical protein
MQHFDLTSKTRIRSLDFLRGLVMVLMAIDHVRVYSGMPSWGATPGIFFTRWVTHFCVPTFVFFAGTSAFLYGNQDQRQEGAFPLSFYQGTFADHPRMDDYPVFLDIQPTRMCRTTDTLCRWGLPLLYLVFILVEIVLFLVCKKYMKYKAQNPDKKWLRYI